MIPAGMDTRTLIVALLAQLSLLGVLTIYFGMQQTGTRAMGVWGGGLIMVAAGFGAIALRGVVPDLLSITIANTLAMASNLFFYRAIRIMKGKPVDDPLGLAALAATTVLIYLYSEVTPNLTARVSVVSVISVLFYARNALELRESTPAEVRASQRFMQAIYWFATLITLMRIASNLRNPGNDLMAPDAAQSLYFLLLLMATGATFGIFWMENQYLHYEIARQAARDSLTGMLNRGSFLTEFERELSRVRRGAKALSLAMFDLDHFKQLNDTHGHPAGDEVLRAVAASMRSSLRQQDTLGRYGGEEFALVMPDSDAEAAMRVAERIRAAVQTRGVQWQHRRLSITISGGIASYAVHGESGEKLIAAADAALYEAKRSGRNRIHLAAARTPDAGTPGTGAPGAEPPATVSAGAGTPATVSAGAGTPATVSAGAGTPVTNSPGGTGGLHPPVPSSPVPSSPVQSSTSKLPNAS